MLHIKHQTLSHQLVKPSSSNCLLESPADPFQDIKPVIPSLIYVPRGTSLSDRGPLRRRTHTTVSIQTKVTHRLSEIPLESLESLEQPMFHVEHPVDLKHSINPVIPRITEWFHQALSPSRRRSGILESFELPCSTWNIQPIYPLSQSSPHES
jgi:hypothetical protein